MDIFAQQLEVRHKRRRWTFGAALAMLIVPLGLLLGLLATPNGRETIVQVGTTLPPLLEARDPETFFQGRDRVNVVFIGRDVDYDNHNRLLNTQGRSDTLIVASIARGDKDVRLLNIPRDTYAYIPGGGHQRINAAHSLGGPEKVVETLQQSLGLRTHFWVQLKFDGFKRAIDALGGVEVDVPKDMNYDDNWANFHIHLKKGLQKLNGAQAHGFVRFRHDKLGDIGRIQRQQMLIKALARQLLTPSSFLSSPTTIGAKIKALRSCVNTNMEEEQLFALALFLKSVDPESLHAEMLPGRPQSAYWVVDKIAGAELLSTLFRDSFDPSQWEARVVASLPKAAIKAAKDAEGTGEEPVPVLSDEATSDPTGKVPPPAEPTMPTMTDPVPPEPANPEPGKGEGDKPKKPAGNKPSNGE